MSGPDRVFLGRAGRLGPLGVAGRGSLISPGVAGRAGGARVGDPPRPCQPSGNVTADAFAKTEDWA